MTKQSTSKLTDTSLKKKLESELIYTPYVSTYGQLVDVLTKGLSSSVFQRIISKFGMENAYSQSFRVN